MKKFDTLYKRSKTGQIVYWQITTDILTYPTIYKESGQLGTTSPIQHREEVKEGKQKRSAAEQAIFMAESDWKKKKDEGYKSLDDLRITPLDDERGGYRVQELSGNYIGTLEACVNHALPKFNSDASGNVKPMLATDWKKIKKIEYPCYIQPKLDGVRCLMIVRFNVGQEKVVTFLSRNGKEYATLDHIEADLGIYCFKQGKDPVEFILDGEIYSDELTFQEIIAASKKYVPNSLKLHFRAYDIVNDSNQHQRLQQTQQKVRQIGSEHVTMVETQIVDNPVLVKGLHDQFVQEGNEGAMLRLMEGKYGQGQRSRDLLKVKEFDETEFQARRFEFGQRGAEDLIVVCETKDMTEFKAKVVGSKEAKEKMYQDFNGIIGEYKFTVKHFGWTTDGIPRFPIGKAIRDYE